MNGFKFSRPIHRKMEINMCQVNKNVHTEAITDFWQPNGRPLVESRRYVTNSVVVSSFSAEVLTSTLTAAGWARASYK
jgi:hypothetical protein